MSDNVIQEDFRFKLSFVASVISMIIIYAASSSIIPLYSNHVVILGITKVNLSMDSVTYFLGILFLMMVQQ